MRAEPTFLMVAPDTDRLRDRQLAALNAALSAEILRHAETRQALRVALTWCWLKERLEPVDVVRQVDVVAPRQADPPPAAPASFLAAGELARARQHIQRQQEKIERLETALREATRPAPQSIRVGRLTINLLQRRVALDGRSFEATGGELALLAYLAQRPENIFDTATLAAGIGCNDGSARTYMWRLRPKMRAIGAAAYLQSKGRGGAWGGYWMTDADRGEQARHE